MISNQLLALKGSVVGEILRALEESAEVVNQALEAADEEYDIDAYRQAAADLGAEYYPEAGAPVR